MRGCHLPRRSVFFVPLVALLFVPAAAATEDRSAHRFLYVVCPGIRDYLDTRSHTIVQEVGPFAGSIRPFTVNGAATRAYICVNDLLGFEIGDLTSGMKLHRVEVAGFATGPVKRHGCPSHGIGLTPDERDVWVVDAFNQQVHVFDNTVEPPRQKESIAVREQPGWITFSLDGKFGYPSTGEVIDVDGKKVIGALSDELGRPVHSEKMIEIDFNEGVPVAAGDQFGVGRMMGGGKEP
ncbi:MAG TPA: hypothetical protein VND64_18460 [Pirellulales bacterium]|nr:hypothetical protein [Pirellulales bacterium]